MCMLQVKGCPGLPEQGELRNEVPGMSANMLRVMFRSSSRMKSEGFKRRLGQFESLSLHLILLAAPFWGIWMLLTSDALKLSLFITCRRLVSNESILTFSGSFLMACEFTLLPGDPVHSELVFEWPDFINLQIRSTSCFLVTISWIHFPKTFVSPLKALPLFMVR